MSEIRTYSYIYNHPSSSSGKTTSYVYTCKKRVNARIPQNIKDEIKMKHGEFLLMDIMKEYDLSYYKVRKIIGY